LKNKAKTTNIQFFWAAHKTVFRFAPLNLYALTSLEYLLPLANKKGKTSLAASMGKLNLKRNLMENL